MAETLARASQLAVPVERLRTICASLGKIDEAPQTPVSVSQLGQGRHRQVLLVEVDEQPE